MKPEPCPDRRRHDFAGSQRTERRLEFWRCVAGHRRLGNTHISGGPKSTLAAFPTSPSSGSTPRWRFSRARSRQTNLGRFNRAIRRAGAALVSILDGTFIRIVIRELASGVMIVLLFEGNSAMAPWQGGSVHMPELASVSLLRKRPFWIGPEARKFYPGLSPTAMRANGRRRS